jgi:dihydrofolate reductase
MRKLLVSEWMTLDCVFDADTMAEWWNPYTSPEREAYVQERIAAAGAFVLGRKTYEMLAPYWSAMKNNEMGVAAKLNSAPKYVVSSTLKAGEWNNTTVIKGGVVEEITKLKNEAGKDLLIMGSATLLQSLMAADLIDEYWFLVQPIVMGRGKRVFKDSAGPSRLKLVRTTTLGLGVVGLCYRAEPTPARRE